MAKPIETTPALNKRQYTTFLEDVFSNEEKRAPKEDVVIAKSLFKKLKNKPMFE